MNAIAQIRTDLLTVHPLLEPLPPLEFESPEMAALIESIDLHGIVRPVITNSRHEIMDDDGRSTVRAAAKAGFEHVPVVIEADEDAASLILSGLCARRHLTKSARAYLAFPLMEAGRDARLARRSANLKGGWKSRTSLKGTFGETVEEMADRLGFDRKRFYHARNVVGLFHQQPAFKAQMEPLLLSGEVSLQGVLAGWTGKQNEGKSLRKSDQLDLFGDCFKALRYHFGRTWKTMDEVQHAAIAPQVRETVADMPPEVRALFLKEIRDAEKAAREAARTV